jgi:hypothetical protein
LQRLRRLSIALSVVLALVHTTAFALPEPVSPHASDASLPGKSATRVVIRVDDTQAMRELERQLAKTGARIVRYSVDGGAVTVEVPAEYDSRTYSAHIERTADVAFAEPLGIVRASAVPNDPSYSQQWGLPAINAPAAWDYTWGESGITIAVIDSGVDLDHPDLINQIQPGGWDFVSNDPVSDDVHGHGTFVAGIAAAQANNNLFGAGTAPGVRILPIRVLDALGDGTTAGVADGIRYAVDHGAEVINLSLGTPDPAEEMRLAVEYAQAHDVVLVAGAGNTYPTVAALQYPARYDGVIGVGAVASTLAIADFSCRGPELDIVGPGVAIRSTMKDGGWGEGGGTSFAAPFVAGSAALIRSVAPSFSATQVANTLYAAANDLGAAGRDDTFGHGMLQAGLSVAVAAGAPVTALAAPAANTAGWYTSVPTIALTPSVPAATYYRWGSNPQQTYSGPIQPPVQGTNVLTYWSRDAAGLNEIPKSATFKVDTASPSVPLGLTAVPLSSAAVRLNWSASADDTSGIKEYEVRLASGQVLGKTATTSLSVQGLAPATTYTFVVASRDNAGNTSAPSGQASATTPIATYLPVYRFYNFTNGTHFFTPSKDERDMVISRWPNVFRYEGEAYYVNAANTQPLYRFYNRVSASHFYTASAAEADNVKKTWPNVFTYEGETYAVATSGSTADAVYRFYNKRNGSHFFTASAAERDSVIARWPNIYAYEGTAYYLGKQ